MPQTYYVNAATGSDSNAGTSASAALQSLVAVNKLNLQPGDTVLLASGTSYSHELDITASGTPDHPITFGTYGDGPPPEISGPSMGIHGPKTHDIVIDGLAISHTHYNAVYAADASDWTLRNLTITDSGTSAHSGGISFQQSSQITIENNAISGVTGDGIWVEGGSGITISGNRVDTLQGTASDNVQVQDAYNVVIEDNRLDLSGHTNSTKGNVLANHDEGVIIEHNTMIGGSYGASVNSDDVTIAHNDIYGQTGFTWSFGIGIGEQWDVRNYDIYDNQIHDGRYGVAVTGKGDFPVYRENIDVHDNSFDNLSGTAIKVDRPASGEFHHNWVSADTVPTKVSDDVAASGDFRLGHVHDYVPDGPVAHADTVDLTMHADEVSGKLLANDTDGRHNPLTLAEFAGETGDGTLSIAGKYGVVSVDANGNFVYAMNDGAMDGAIHSTTDVFTYLVTDGVEQSAAQLTVDLLPRMEVRPIAFNDTAAIGADGSIGGNVLSNDHDANHDTLYLRWMGGERVGGTANTTIEGKYGTLSVDQHGDYLYHADAADALASGVLHDTFLYKISDSTLQDTANLSVSIDPHTLTPDWGLGFHI